ncbi:MAG: DUF2442 domain-containing protein [Caldilineaceae bacterium]|nr:DUF2442 domain-containing protein [Caldilineaceae bacterium]
MNTVVIDLQNILIEDIDISEDTLTVDLSDGRSLQVPLAWYPRLYHGTPAERRNWRLIGRGVGIHWPDLDEDLSAEGLLLGKKSTESQSSLARWLEKRKATQPVEHVTN